MRIIYLLFALIVCLTIVKEAEGRYYLTIDSFLDRNSPPLVALIQIPVANNYWWTPYPNGYIAPRVPFARVHNVESCLGGQRDLVLGYEGITPSNTVSVCSVASEAGTIAFALDYIGGAYYQYDGDDFGADNPATKPTPGAFLNRLPGMGARPNSTSFPERNNDGISIDFTSGGAAIGLFINIVADHKVFYYLDAIDVNGEENHYDFLGVEASESIPRVFFIRFDTFNDTSLTGWDNRNFDWSRTAAFQVRVWTFNPREDPGDQESPAIDTAFGNLRTFGYEIRGNVQIDCECNGSGESAVVGERMNLFRAGAPTTVVAFTNTNANGDFFFGGPILGDGQSFQVCLDDLSLDKCTPSNGCLSVTLSNFNDPLPLQYFITNPETLEPPPDRVIECDECQTTTCLGTATRFDCAGNSIPITTFTDSPSGTCPTIIRRTFIDAGLRVTQTITVNDNDSPVITQPAADVTVQCTTSTPSLSTFVSTRSGAQATDCSSFTWSNNWNGQQLTTCGAVTVTFTATDACANPGASTTATYRIQDSVAPVINPGATSSSANCNNNNSDFTAFNTWRSTRGGAQATDNCGTFIWSDNYVDGDLTRGCSDSVVVIYTATDNCGNAATTSASFTINDTSGPRITTPAANQGVECSSSSTTAFNTWRSNHAGAVAVDDCQSSAQLAWSDNFVGSAPSGCSATSGPVTFTVTDGCGTPTSSSSTTATFTVTDTQPPRITTQASPLSVDCSEDDSSSALNTWLNTQGGAVAVDDCTSITWTNNFNPETVDCGSTPVTFTASDQCANPRSVRTTANFSIVDNQAPTFNPVPSSITVECGPSAQSSFTSWLNSVGGGQVSDNCASSAQIVVSNNWPVGTLPALGCLTVATVQWTATDPCGNRSPPVTATFTISDTTPPSINPPGAQSQTVDCGSSSTSQYNTFLSTRAGATATEVCTSITWSNNGPATPVFDGCSGTTVVTFTARDSCSLTATTTASFTIVDQGGPSLTTEAQDVTEQCTGSASNAGVNSWVARNGGAVASDACSSVTWTNNFNGLSGGCNSVATVTFTARDSCQNAVSTTATYSVVDTVGPVITTPAQNRNVPCNDQTQSEAVAWLQSHGGAVAVDACSPNDLTWTNTLLDVIGCDFATVTFTVSDSCGFSSSTTATFTSTDASPPTFNPPAADLLVECNGGGNTEGYNSWVASHGGAVAVDSCAFSFTWTDNAPDQGPVGCGAQTVTFTVTDNCNNSARTTATFRVQDSTPPTISPPPAELSVSCDGTGNSAELNSWIASRGGAEAFDLCTGTVTWTQTAGANTGDGCQSIRPYTFTATDGCGNRASATANFVIRDFDAPIITTPVSDISFECDGSDNLASINNWLNSNGGAVADDLCQSTVSWTNDYPGSGPVPCSSLVVTFTVSDACGNRVSDSGTVAIEDTLPPAFTFFPADITLPCDADVSTATRGMAVASDQCLGSVFVSVSETSFDEPAIGNCPGDHIITRTFSAADECGNFVSQDQIITVEIVRSSGPCDPVGCECDNCCPQPVASNCLAVDCQPAACNAVPCTASACTCSTNFARDQILVPEDLVQPLPQCKPVYIYVNDDDDSEKPESINGVAQQRMLITNEPLHENALKRSSGASVVAVSIFAMVFALILSLF